MGCVCCRKDQEDQESELSKSGDNYGKERLVLDYGQINIQVKNTLITEVEAQLFISATTNLARIQGNPIIKKHKIEINVDEHHLLENGSIFFKDLKNNQKIIFLVLPLWRGGIHNEKQLFEQAVDNVLKYFENEQFESIVMDEVGALKFGYPRQDIQLIIEVLVGKFSKYLQNHKNQRLKHITFVSHEMCTVNLFEKEIKKLNGLQQQEMENEEKLSKKYEKQDKQQNDLEKPLLSEL